MNDPSRTSPGLALDQRVTVPEHVVFRSFGDETVVLNMKTGQYHGLNGTAGVMLEAIREHGRLDEVAAQLARDFDQDRGRVERDLMAFCEQLFARELLARDDGA